MKNTSENLKTTFIKVKENKVVRYILVGVIILLFLARIVGNKFFKGESIAQMERLEFAIGGTDVKGKINTDAVGENVVPETSKYTIEDGFSEYESTNTSTNNNPTNNSNNSSNYIPPVVNVDKSSLKGNDITIFEGDSFEPIRDLKLRATDKDGSNISDRIIIKENNVNTEKPGVYQVRVSVTLNTGYEMERVFNVNVMATDLKVSVASFEAENKEVEKKEKIILNLDIKSSKKYVKANTVTINGKEYPAYKAEVMGVSLLSNTQKYKVELQADSISGEKEFELECIKMSDNSLIEANNIVKLEVLKSEAIVEDFKYEVKSSEKALYISFKLKDVDSSASNLRMEIYKDEELITSKSLDKKGKYNEEIETKTNGVYDIKVIGDINITTKEDKVTLNKELLSKTITINDIDESHITGENIELIVGQEFDIKKDLKLKATDVNGEDITHKIVVESNNVNVSEPGEYAVSVYVTNKNGEKIKATFIVAVKADSTSENPGNANNENGDSNLEGRRIVEFDFNSQKGNVFKREIVSGNDTQVLDVKVKITGVVAKGDGESPDGMLMVEVPTKLAFSVDQDGNLSGAGFTIKNNSSSPVMVSVGAFQETNPGKGITIKPLGADLTNLDRANVHLYLRGDDTVDLGEPIVEEKPLVEVSAMDSRFIQLLGDAGKGASEEVDQNGTSEDFDLVFKIKKKSN